MTIDQMRQYIAVVKHMSFTKAAIEGVGLSFDILIFEKINSRSKA